ncbi:hypothetical protein DOO78_20240 [Roseicella frigidaeris]|uniref:Uncharacterized protein n=2 Tax=Roseicella frigidaeris TaxID=2230885 RepID=A0A327M4K9_9PROT|nr:hypothetical protein DOO78_20240 [Roseicella frigidaeris]
MTGHAESGSGEGQEGLWRAVVWGGAATLLLAPLVAMRFTDEVQWTKSDFVVFGVMVTVPLAVLELAVRATVSMPYRAAVAVALGAAFLMTWLNLAVGIIGNENNPFNLMFFGVLAVGIVGAFIARFQPRGMARALVAMGAAQGLAAITALVAGHSAVLLNGIFAAAWLISAWLFWKAAGDQAVVQNTG